ncbi:hypothetical protein DKY63_29130 [Pseudomonas putida]|uniref:Uncharacterized protein n=1 Tax=Pseudomonas putida TaxID=303 RepID=A0A2Z4RSZ2_PSEPU|nr:hypothetical protein DKY63_29130 [Pseudomonas putida]
MSGSLQEVIGTSRAEVAIPKPLAWLLLRCSESTFFESSKPEIEALWNHPLLLGVTFGIGILTLGSAMTLILMEWLVR